MNTSLATSAPRRVSIPYAPRPQQALFHELAARFNVGVCHRRMGKTVMAVNEIIKRLIQCPHKNPQAFYIAPTYAQAKRVAFDYFKEYAGVLPDFKVNEAELRIEFTVSSGRARIYLAGGDAVDSLRGIYADFAVLDEYANMNRRLLPEVIRPALADRSGGYLIIGTPAGHDAFHEVYESHARKMKAGDAGYFTMLMPASETGVLPDEELQALRESMSPEEYAQELECNFDAAIRGAYYAKALELIRLKGRVKDIGHDPALPVHTGWDLGMSDSTAVWFLQQAPGREIRVIDYYEASGEPLSHYVSMLQRREYVYGKHYFPHDVMVQDLSSGHSRYEILQRLGIRPSVVAKLPVKDGIEAVRVLLPRCWFDDSPDVRNGLDKLGRYRAQWDPRGNRWRTQPVHDETSHSADAFRTIAVGMRDGSPDDLATIARKNRLLGEGGGAAVITDYNEFDHGGPVYV
jgi:phage terminase large subunit